MTALEKRIQKLLVALTHAHTVDVAQKADKSISAEIHFASQTAKLKVLWAGEGWPDDVRAALSDEAMPPSAQTVVFARRLAPGSLKMLNDVGANWADETGAAHIDNDQMIVMRDGAGESADSGPIDPSKFEWSNSAIDIAESILAIGEESPLRVNELSDSTGWSTQQISNVLRAFESRGWVQSTGAERGRSARRILADKMGLLNSWSERIADKPSERRMAHAMTDDLMSFLRRELAPKLNQHTRWAVTGWAGGELLAPFTSIVPTLQIYVDESQFGPSLIRAVGLTPVDEGGAIEFLPASHVALSLASRTSDHLLVASPARVFADLKSLGGRGEDAANHLLTSIFEMATSERALVESDEGAFEDLRDWEQGSRNRLTQKMNEFEPAERPTQYRHGNWTASYILRGIKEEPHPTDLLDTLLAIKGQETGRPPWLVSDIPDSKPYPIDGMIECWLMGGRNHDSDFWRASPNGSLFMLRALDEDSPREDTEPGKIMSLSLPVWRTGECLLHSGRLAERLGANKIDFMMRWEGLRGRELSAMPSRDRWMPPGRTSAQNVVTTMLRITPAEIQFELPNVVRNLVEPLYTAFDFFRPPESLYREELVDMRERIV